MDALTYNTVLLSIVLGLAITQVLLGFRGLMLTRARVKLYSPTLIWAIIVLFVPIQAWWADFTMREHPNCPGFVRSSEHDSATDSDRLAAQRWIERVFDRSIERIQFRMKDRGSRFQLFFVHQEQLYPRCKLSELIKTERLFNGNHPVHHAFETIFAKKLVFFPA